MTKIAVTSQDFVSPDDDAALTDAANLEDAIWGGTAEETSPELMDEIYYDEQLDADFVIENEVREEPILEKETFRGLSPMPDTTKMKFDELLATLPTDQQKSIGVDIIINFFPNMTAESEIEEDADFIVAVEPMSLYKGAVNDLLERCWDLGDGPSDDVRGAVLVRFGLPKDTPRVPSHGERIERIVTLLKSGQPHFPIIRDWDDRTEVNPVTVNQLCEGMHRMIAFAQLDLPTLTVIYVAKHGF
jgi:hypothetical protein